MKVVEQPALTKVMPIDATIQDKIDYLNEQISELKQQKKCYDKMIKERKKAIKNLKERNSFRMKLEKIDY